MMNETLLTAGASLRKAKRGSWWAACLAAILLSGCKPNLPTEVNNLPDVAGEWSYAATDLQITGIPGARCGISGLTLLIGPWRYSGFYGRSVGGTLTCSGSLAPLSGPFESYPVRRGGAVAEHIAFDLGTPDWRHEGILAADTMSGIFRLNHSGLQMTGQFRAVRRSTSVETALQLRTTQTEK
jgi:hypothetical protein